MGIITVSKLGKAYKQYPSRWSRLREWLSPSGRPRHALKWVLSDISFTVNKGEAVGIVGVNGAGKSTLLKMICGTTQPTTGSVDIRGRVAALLELGMGFHPDFTGRQNAIMAGQLLGYGADEVAGLMQEIQSFAEIGEYLDQPVRVYSSGMQVRLAFSVATARRPDVLIVDEALSVGDAYFQHKSFDRIRKFRECGTTLLLVSHDRHAIQSICDKVILINGGRVEMVDAPDVVMDYYAALLAERQIGHQIIQKAPREDGRAAIVSGTGEASVTAIVMFDASGEIKECFEIGESVVLEVLVEVKSPIPKLVLGFTIRDRLGNPVYGTNTYYADRVVESARAGEKYRFRFEFELNIGVGTFSVTTALVGGQDRYVNNYECNELALIFKTINTNYCTFVGSSWLNADVSVMAV